MDDVTTKELFLEMGDGKIFAKVWSPEKTDQSRIPPLFLLHDSLGCVDTWREFPALLCKKLRTTVIAYDRLGYGRSTARTELPFYDFVRKEADIVFPRVRALLGVTDFAVMGHSVGGCMALLSAIHQPTNRAVVAESVPVINQGGTPEGLRQAQIRFGAPDRIERLKKYHGEKAEWVLRAWTEVWLSPAFSDWEMTDDLSKITTPVLTLHGARDEYASTDLPERIHRTVRGVSEIKIFDGVGHVPHREVEADVLEVIADFLIERA